MIKHTINTIESNFTRKEKVEGETLETKIERIVNGGEPISDGAPLIYQERNEGVNPDMDIRSDRFEAAIEAMDVASKSKLAKRVERHKTAEQKAKEAEAAKAKAAGQSTQGTES